MGVRLIVEVLDHWHDAGLTAGERDDLMVLAENANDGSRLTWGPVHEAYILKRANKSAASWKNSVSKLLRKKVLTQHVPGRVKQAAVYHLACLCPDPPHDGYKGFCTRPERVTSQMTHPEGVEKEGHLSDDPQGHSTDDPQVEEGHLSDDERVTGEVTPTPLVPSFNSPSDTPSSSVAEASSDVLEGVVIEGGGGGESDSRDITKRADKFVDRLDYRGKQPTRSQKDSLRILVGSALRDGWTEQTLTDYLDLGDAVVKSPASVYKHRLAGNERPEPPTPLAAARSQLPPPCAQCFETYREAAQTNLRLRMRDGHLCPDCHPGSDSYQARQRDMDGLAEADGGMWGRAMDRAQGRMAADNWQGAGTDERVAGWAALAGSLEEREAALNGPTLKPASGGYQPSRPNEFWHRLDAQASNGLRPDGADRVPHCGADDCDEYSRTRGDSHTPCNRCHPALKF